VRVASVVLDVDSTLCGVEGVDWLAQRKGGDVAQRVRELTDRAMNGQIPLDAVYGERLALIRPSRDDIQELSRVYRQTIAPGAADAFRRWIAAGIRVVLVSGGIRPAISPLARELGVPVEAVDLTFDEWGGYRDFDRDSALTTQGGKLAVLRRLGLPHPILAVGDGSTDVAMKDAADRLVAFTGFVRRAAIVQAADAEVASFDELATMVTGSR
jgi:phosphoserine phosphatase